MYDHVTWPERYDPKTSAIYALNDVDVKAPQHPGALHRYHQEWVESLAHAAEAEAAKTTVD